MKVLNGYAVFAVDDPAPILEIMPSAKHSVYQGKQIVAVPHTLEAMMIMRSFGLDAPAPTEDYTYPGQFRPYQHQKVTMQFMVENPRCYVLSGMGTGKTAATAWAADFLMTAGAVRMCLIIAPLSCLEKVWGDHLYRSLPKRKFVVLHGSRQQRLDLLKTKWDFAVINPAGLGIIREYLPVDVDLIVIDELAVFRNHKTKTLWGEAKKMIKPHHWVWGLTGSPTPNAPYDAFAQSKLVTPERYNGSFTRFKMDTMLQLSQFKFIPRSGAEKLVDQVLQPSIRYALEDCVDLPPTIYSEREAELSREQLHHYTKLKKECITEIKGQEVTAVNAAVLFSKLFQCACGVLRDSNGSTVELDFGPRLDVLKELIEEASGKLIIFVPFTGVLDALAAKLKKHWTVAVVDGGVSAGKRNQIFTDFCEKDSPRLIIAHPACMAHGLSMHQKCATIVWFAPIASHDIYCQACARIVRPGQKSITHIIHISGSPIERKVYQALQERGKFQDLVLGMVQEG